jgi:hydrogenase maturation protease
MTRAVVIGVGNDYRGDDGAALAIVRRLEGSVPEGVTVRAFEQEPTRLIDAWDGADTAVVVDAAGSGAEPGTLHRFDASATPIPASVFRSSTHAFGVGEAIELARALGRLPRRVVVYGVEGGSFAAGEELSPAVAEAVEPAAAAVLEELARLTREEEPCTSGR